MQKPTMRALAEKWQPEIQLRITQGPIHDWYEGIIIIIIKSWFDPEAQNGAYIDTYDANKSAPVVE